MNLRRFFRSGDPWTLAALVIIACIIVPLAGVLLGMFQHAPQWSHLLETVLGLYLRNTIVLGFSVCLLALLMAVPAAWLLSAFDFPGRRWLEWAMVLPLSIPTYVAAFVYIQVPEAAIPWLISIRRSHGVDAYLRVEGLLRHGLLALFLASVLYPYLYLSLRSAFLVQRRGVIEAAHTLGRGPTSVFFGIALPLARPALIAGLGLILMEVINDYGAVEFFGVPTLSVGIFRTWGGMGDRASAVRIAGMLMCGVFGLLALERAQRGRARFSESAADPAPVLHRPLRPLAATGALLACLWPLLIGFILPLAQLLIWTAQTLPRLNSIGLLGDIGRSLGLSLGAAAALTALALVVVYALRLHPQSFLQPATGLATLGYAVPGVVVAVGVWTVLGALSLGGGILAIALGYLVRFFAVPVHPLRAAMTRVCGSLDEASRLLGHSPLRTLWRINLPLIRGSLLASLLLVFVDILKELPLTMILRPVDFETLATLSFGKAKEGLLQESAIPSLLIVLLAAAGLALLNPLFRHERRA